MLYISRTILRTYTIEQHKRLSFEQHPPWKPEKISGVEIFGREN